MKKALLVGINKYQGSPLRGCVNDVLVVFQILTEKFKFKHSDIKVLTDYEATRANIIDGIKWLTTGVGDGDSILFHYSGHGSQINVSDWTSSDEADGLDEIIIQVDMDWNKPIRDNELGMYFKRVPKSCNTTVVLDSCHSGTCLRNGFGPLENNTENDYVNRFISPPVSNILTNPSLIIKDDLSFDFPDPAVDSRAIRSKFLVDTVDQGDAILIAGCMENQTSADAWINKRYQGAMTYALAKTLNDHNFNITYKDLVTKMNVLMKKFKFTQVPQLECKDELMNKLFL